MRGRAWIVGGSFALLQAAALAAAGPPPTVGGPVSPRLSPPLRSLPVADAVAREREKGVDRINPLAAEPDQGRRGTWNRTGVPVDPLAAEGVLARRTPSPLFTFAGTGNPAGCGGCSPPDTVGDIGPNHYLQVVNATKVVVFAPDGTVIEGPYNLGTLWSSGACTGNAGDPVVLYDPLADRWVIAQFNSGNSLCFAVSTSADPADTYHVYAFPLPSFPDYFKVGVWSDGYYVGANESSYTALAFDRESMLAGLAATYVRFTGGANFLLPADVDGVVPPPAGAPGLFYTFLDNSFHGGSDRIELYELHADWITPANSTFINTVDLAAASFTYTACGFFNFNCARQLDTTQRIDVVSEWPMFRFAYRNFGSHESLAGTFTVGGATAEVGAAPRWFEARRSGGPWSLHQEGTFDPGTDTLDRFMGSVAMDGAGNLALGFSASSSAIYPRIEYATRFAGDPLGTLSTQATMMAGAGSQTGSDRWGDYSAMGVDPADDCTFFYTNEYYASSSATNWSTRVGAFRLPGCDTLYFDDFEVGATSRWDATVLAP